MIYDKLSGDRPLQQGDIFQNIPFAEMSLSNLPVLDGDVTALATWNDLVATGDSRAITALVGIQPVFAIVLTQDCDAARGKHLCLAQIDKFLDVTNKRQNPPKNAKKWQSLITAHMKENLRYFYLPPDPAIGFGERMAADFRVIIRVPREDLLNLRHYRLGRLNNVAYEHFRESLAQYFRRYPYNEWYPLTREEVDEYSKGCEESIEKYEWQK